MRAFLFLTPGSIDQFAVRFGSVEIAQQFKQKFEEAQKYIKQQQKSRPAETSSSNVITSTTTAAAAASTPGL